MIENCITITDIKQLSHVLKPILVTFIITGVLPLYLMIMDIDYFFKKRIERRIKIESQIREELAQIKKTKGNN